MIIAYAKGYKYQLRCDVLLVVPIYPDRPAITDLVELDCRGRLLIRKYFAWDGVSGPAINTRTNLRGGLGHDALYYLMRAGQLPLFWRRRADEYLAQAMIEDGAWRIRADAYLYAVDQFALPFAQQPRKIYEVTHKGKVWHAEKAVSDLIADRIVDDRMCGHDPAADT